MVDNDTTKKELDLSKKVAVKNISNSNVSFHAFDPVRDVRIPAKSKTTLSVNEIMSQVYAPNKLFVGLDGKGGHACLYIEDKDLRVEFGFETNAKDSKQEIIDENSMKEIFNLSKKSHFVKALTNAVKTIMDRQLLGEYITSGKVNEYYKVQMAEKLLKGEPIK